MDSAISSKKLKTAVSRENPKQIFSIGHSTHPIEEFIEWLKAHDIKAVIDVRSIPKSRHCPQYNKDELKQALKEAKIGYRHLKELGGLRHTTKDSINTAWINLSFRGFADYMQTPAFHQGLEKLEKICQSKRCALMCAEAVPWRCHRSLIADALTKDKWKVYHIQSKKRAPLHKITPFLHIRKGMLIYSNELKSKKAQNPDSKDSNRNSAIKKSIR